MFKEDIMRKLLTGVLAIACGVVFSGVAAWAEDNRQAVSDSAPAGQEMRRGPGAGNHPPPTAAELQEMMGPRMEQMMGSMIKSMARAMADPQVAQNLATFARNYYLALKERGFSDEEAMKIVTSTGVPSLGGKQ